MALTIPEFPGEKSSAASSKTSNLQIAVEDMSIDELIELRGRVDACLPARKLTDLNIEEEVVIQFQVAQRLQTETLKDDGALPNQKAATLNAVASALAALTKMQQEVYTSERLKRIEQLLIEQLRTLPTAAQEDFLTRYEALLRKNA